ncbi:MAG TPA: DUF1552 domain-containing protein [Fimbriimonadaceae bacterium]|nr:DUF1552 domain-containing protein [Fimbriimonadaceae bacterium]HRJ97842.1 DUF1552 domain-containing protein [Fimbriimonadaceae bacterium]
MGNRISRRTVLRGLGTTISLPLLEGMLPLSALAQTAKVRPSRMAFVFVPNGIDMANWTPQGMGTALELSPILQPLEKVRGSLNVLTGLAQHNAFALGDGPGDHARSTAAWLTGVHPKKTAGSDIRVGISADQVAAREIGHKTRFPSLEIGCERGAMAGDCDSGYSCAYSSSISWKSETTPVAKEVNPRLVFERLFGSGDAEETEAKTRRDFFNKSILDFVFEDAMSLRGRLGARDQRKLDEYLNGVREIEQRLIAAEKQALDIDPGKKPTGVPRDYGEHIRLMSDMMVLAFQADLTRIATFMYANDGSNRSYPMIGVSDGHHDVSHHGKNADKLEKKQRIDLFHTQQLAYMLEKMASIDEVDGTLLDNSMIVYGAGISDGDRHNHDDLPILLAGGGAGTLKGGRHLRFDRNTPMNNLFLSMLDRVGVRVEKLGDSTGKLQGLF